MQENFHNQHFFTAAIHRARWQSVWNATCFTTSRGSGQDKTLIATNMQVHTQLHIEQVVYTFASSGHHATF